MEKEKFELEKELKQRELDTKIKPEHDELQNMDHQPPPHSLGVLILPSNHHDQ